MSSDRLENIIDYTALASNKNMSIENLDGNDDTTELFIGIGVFLLSGCFALYTSAYLGWKYNF